MHMRCKPKMCKRHSNFKDLPAIAACSRVLFQPFLLAPLHQGTNAPSPDRPGLLYHPMQSSSCQAGQRNSGPAASTPHSLKRVTTMTICCCP